MQGYNSMIGNYLKLGLKKSAAEVRAMEWEEFIFELSITM